MLLLGLGLTGLQAQTAPTSTGGNASGSGGPVSYTVGQVAYSSYESACDPVVERNNRQKKQ